MKKKKTKTLTIILILFLIFLAAEATHFIYKQNFAPTPIPSPSPRPEKNSETPQIFPKQRLKDQTKLEYVSEFFKNAKSQKALKSATFTTTIEQKIEKVEFKTIEIKEVKYDLIIYFTSERELILSKNDFEKIKIFDKKRGEIIPIQEIQPGRVATITRTWNLLNETPNVQSITITY